MISAGSPKVVELRVQVPDLPARHEHQCVVELECGELVDEELWREPPSPDPFDVGVDPRRREVVARLPT